MKRKGITRDSETTRVLVFKAMLAQAGLPLPHREWKFDEDGIRRFRFDYCWPDRKLALEQEGGVWIHGRHNRGSGFLKDMDKYNLAATQGWRILRVTPQQLCTDETIDLIRKALHQSEAA